MRYVDLHIHTTCSDGTLTPEEIVSLALKQEMSAIAITDHDTVAGISAAQAAGDAAGLQVLSGIEISTEYHGREVHLLGYFINPNSQHLKPVLEWTVKDRDLRNEKIVAMLRKDGYRISLEQLKAEHPNTVIGRPHIAEALLKAGQVGSIQDAFDRLLADGKPYFLPRTYIPFAQAAEVIYQAGGVPVLAHPLQYQFPAEELNQFIHTAANCGAVGLEVYYSGYGPEKQNQLKQLGDQYNLIYTGGSDYHGTRKPHIQLGTGMGHLRVPETAVVELEARWKQAHAR